MVDAIPGGEPEAQSWCDQSTGTAGRVDCLRRLRLGLIQNIAIALFMGAFVSLTALAPASVANAANDICPQFEFSLTCTGNQSAGIRVDGGTVNVINVLDLTTAIAPVVDRDGVAFSKAFDGDMVINVDTNGFGITTVGLEADGILGEVLGNGSVTITHANGPIDAGRYGIYGYVLNDGNVTIDNAQSTITSAFSGITGWVNGSGDVAITNKSSSLDIIGDGIYGFVGGNGSVKILNTKSSITSSDSGIFSQAGGDGNVSVVNSDSPIVAGHIGLYAGANGTGTIGISNTNSPISTSGYGDGIETVSDTGDITLFNTNSPITTSGKGSGIGATVETMGNLYIINVDSPIVAGVPGSVVIEVKTNPNQVENVPNGIYGFVENGNAVISNNRSPITATAHGIYLEHDAFAAASPPSQITINNDSAITAGWTGVVVNRSMGGGAAVTINNSGEITGKNGFAIDLRGPGDDVINLYAGSVIGGRIDFGDVNPLYSSILTIGPHVQAEITFGDASGRDSDAASAPDVIDVSSSSVATMTGNTLVVKDKTVFGLHLTQSGDLIDKMADKVGAQPTGGENQTTTHGSDDTAANDGPGYSLWASAIGGYRRDEPTASRPGAIDHWFAGVIAGMETNPIDVAGMFGWFGGLTVNRHTLPFNTGHLETDTYLTGIYWKGDFDILRLNLSLQGGIMADTRVRNVGTMDGLRAVRSRYNGWYISHSATLESPFNVLQTPVVASARISYVDLLLASHTEQGTNFPLTIKSHRNGLINTKAQLSFPHLKVHNDGSHSHFDFRLGAKATFDAGSDPVRGSVAGETFTFDATPEDEISGFVGLGITRTSADGRRSLSFNGELQKGFDLGYQVVGEVKATWRF